MQDKTNLKQDSLTRDGFTWLAYVTLGFYTYILNGFGPVMPFLRAELNLSYTLSSLPFSAFAAGILVAGLGGARVAQRLGRRRTFWIGAIGLSIGTFSLLAGQHPVLTISSALIMGTVGSLLLVMIPATLNDRYGDQRAAAITEANVVASLCGALVPIAVGFFARSELGWRVALMAPVLAMLLIGLIFRREPFPEASVQHTRQKTRLPGLFWLYWTVLVLVVSIEFCIIFLGGTFLEVEGGLTRTDAALSMSLFLVAMVLGRLTDSRLVRHIQTTHLLLGALVLAGLGFLVHWSAPFALLSITGLFFAGLGVANLYPLTLSLTVGSAANVADLASARASLASGAAILCLPLALGGLADQVGIRPAYILVALLVLLAGLIILTARRYRTSEPVRITQMRT